MNAAQPVDPAFSDLEIDRGQWVVAVHLRNEIDQPVKNGARQFRTVLTFGGGYDVLGRFIRSRREASPVAKKLRRSLLAACARARMFA